MSRHDSSRPKGRPGSTQIIDRSCRRHLSGFGRRVFDPLQSTYPLSWRNISPTTTATKTSSRQTAIVLDASATSTAIERRPSRTRIPPRRSSVCLDRTVIRLIYRESRSIVTSPTMSDSNKSGDAATRPVFSGVPRQSSCKRDVSLDDFVSGRRSVVDVSVSTDGRRAIARSTPTDAVNR